MKKGIQKESSENMTKEETKEESSILLVISYYKREIFLQELGGKMTRGNFWFFNKNFR